MDLSSNIKELLYKNDCVIIPNIGGFVAQSSTASVDMIEQLVVPPSKSISFNIKLNHNDGLIANHVAQHNNLSFTEAKLVVDRYCQEIEDKLFNNKIVHFNDLGKLFFNADGKLEFIPEKCNFLIDAYGLPDIDCIPILRNKKYTNPARTSATVVSAAASSKTPYTKLIAACIVVGVLLSLLYNNAGFQVNTNPLSAAIDNSIDTNTLSATAAVLPLPRPVIPDSLASTLQTIDDSPKQITTTEPIKPLPSKPKKIVNQQEEFETYVIVLGAFGKKKNADRLSKKLAADNYLPDVSFKNGLNRVGVQISCSADELQKHLQFLRDHYNPKAWLVE